MSMLDDIYKRHQKTEAMRKKVQVSRTTKSVGTDLTAAMMIDMAKMLGQSPSIATNSRAGRTAPTSFFPMSTISGTQVMPPITLSYDTAKKDPTPKPEVKPKIEFSSVVLAEEKKQAIIEALDQLKNNDLIFNKWGFKKTLEKGKAVSMLFYGLPGTGKTLMAQAIADKLSKKLRIIGTAEIESSEPGAAERNIKAIFQGVKKDTILLFDECDSLIYDRANLGSILAAQVNQLLQSLENFEGVVIFTTNRLGVLDEAFNRRLSLKMEFELPNFDERVKIWKRMFPSEAPIGDIDWEELAEPQIAGGHIKNAVLKAARTAASSKKKTKLITQEILKKSLANELREMAKFMEAKENDHTPRQLGYDIRKG